MPALFRLARMHWIGWTAIWLLAAPAGAASWRLEVQGHGMELGETPSVTEIKAAIPPGFYDMRSAQGDKVTIACVFENSGKKYLATVFDHVPAKTSATYSLQARVDPPTNASRTHDRSGLPHFDFLVEKPLGSDKKGEKITVRADGELRLVYSSDQATKPYLYPLIGPTGKSLTRAYPMHEVAGEDRDHPHQRSMWFTHGSVNGFDFWASDPINKPSPKFGTIKETSYNVDDTLFPRLRTTDDWLGPDGKKVCEDERVLTIYGTRSTRTFDFDVTLKATNGPVTFGDTKEGMFGLRVASSMDVNKKKGGKITNAEGITDDAAWGKASPWVDYSGPVEGETIGVAILNHPDSFRYPTTWHVRTYGLFAANPFGWHDFGQKTSGEYTLPAGESLRFRYRLVLHRGTTDQAGIASAFAGYTKPPRVELMAD